MRNRLPVFVVVIVATIGCARASEPALSTSAALLNTAAGTATATQNVRPAPLNRASTLEGSLAAPTPCGVFIEPLVKSPRECQPLYWYGMVNLATGAAHYAVADLALPTAGVPVCVGRVFSGGQVEKGDPYNSDGPQGFNWFQTALPEILVEGDIVRVMTSGNAFFEYERVSTKGEFRGVNGAPGVIVYTAGDLDTHGVYKLMEPNGRETSFFDDGGDSADDSADWKLWKVRNPDGLTLYAGDPSNADTAEASAAYGDGVIKQFIQQQSVSADDDRRYNFNYSSSTIGSRKRLESVTVHAKVSGSYTLLVAQVEYAYYTSNTDAGTNDGAGLVGDLKSATVTLPIDSSNNEVRTSWYRYYTAAWNGGQASTEGHPHALKMAIEPEGHRRAIVASKNLDTATTDSLKEHSAVYFRYHQQSSGPLTVAKAFFNGECGCGSGVDGLTEFTWEENEDYTDDTGAYDPEWFTRTMVKQPDGTYQTRYFDEAGQAVATAVTPTLPSGSSITAVWATVSNRDGEGRVTWVATPETVSNYDHDEGLFTVSTTTGLVNRYTRVSTSGSAALGMVATIGFSAGTTGTVTTTDTYAYVAQTRVVSSSPDVEVSRVLVSQIDRTVAASVYETVNYIYDWWSTTAADPDYFAVKAIKTTLPAVLTPENGENLVHSSYAFLRRDGRVAFTQGVDAVVNATLYNTQGLPVKMVRDVDTADAIGYDSAYEPGDFVYPGTSTPLASSGTELKYASEMTYDTVGRGLLSKLPSGRYTGTVHDVLPDGRLVAFTFPEVTVASGSATHYKGPAGYSVRNLAGRTELSATLGTGTVTVSSTPLSGWISGSDPLDAVSTTLRGSDRAKVRGLSTTIYDGAGVKPSEARSYTVVSTSGTTGAWVGSSGTDYDRTEYGYDKMGRAHRVKDATSTITRTVFDAAGRFSSAWTGTDDDNWTAASGNGAGDDLTQTSAVAYDGATLGGSLTYGNGRVTKRAEYVEGHATTGVGASGSARVATTFYDLRGNPVAQENPVAPHSVTDFDLRRRPKATAGYSSASGFSGSSATSTTTNRVTLSRTSYDARGQVFASRRLFVNQSNGSIMTLLGGADDPDGFLETLLWRDSSGRVIKEGGDRHAKRQYDRFGRVLRQFELARDNDSAYGDADDVSGDYVLTESQTLYDDSGFTGNVMMTATIARHHAYDASGVTGELDTGYSTPAAYTLQAAVSGAEVKGRIFITSFWYDTQDRPVGTVPYGTNGNSSYNRAPSGWASLPSRSSTVLLSETVYDDWGQVSLVKSPRVVSSNPLKTRTLYDVALRRIAEIRNDTGSDSTPADILTTPPAADRDTDVYTRYTYSAGRMATMWVDIDGDGNVDSGDQVTTYTYGVDKSNSPVSAIASNRLLKKVQYPNGASSTASDNTVTYAYNALGQRTGKTDQNAGVHTYTYDDGGRLSVDAATTLGSDVDGGVRRVETAYNARGMVATVTQFDSTSGGDETDQVAYRYDGWGQLEDYQQDNDDLVTGTSGANDYGVRYASTKVSGPGSGVGSTNRRAGLRRTSTVLRYGGGTDAASGSNVHGWSYSYLNSSGDTLLDGDAGWVTQVYKTADDGGSTFCLTEYRYGGDGRMLMNYTAVPGMMQRLYSPGAGDPYAPYLDRWGRITTDSWKVGSGVVFEAAPAYDESSNITSVPQHHTPYGTVYESDGLNRLIGAKTGVVSSGAISGTVFSEEDWTTGGVGGTSLSLSQTGNWTSYLRSKDGSADLSASSTFRDNNQSNVRDVDGTGSTTLNYEVAYDKTGNLTDDDKPNGSGRTESAYGFRYVYDAWNRLVKVYDGNGQSGALVKELRYNGLGHLIAEHVDTDGDGDVDSSDAWRHNQYNERWQLLATWKGSDAKPSETYAHHNAGRDGRGGASYIDALICRDRDKDVDGSVVREERLYYIQNWRHDVVALIRADSASDMKVVERVRYDAYGRPSSFNPADVARAGAVIGPDGDLDNNDDIQAVSGTGAQWYNDFGTGTSGTNFLPDGTKNGFDYTAFSDAWTDPDGEYGGGGFGVLSGANLDNRVGYAGYRFDPTLNEGGGANAKPVYHVRHRVLDSTSGKWFQMDPLGYVSDLTLYEYCDSDTLDYIDDDGMAPRPVPLIPNDPKQLPSSPVKFPGNPAKPFTFPKSPIEPHPPLIPAPDPWSFVRCMPVVGQCIRAWDFGTWLGECLSDEIVPPLEPINFAPLPRREAKPKECDEEARARQRDNQSIACAGVGGLEQYEYLCDRIRDPDEAMRRALELQACCDARDSFHAWHQKCDRYNFDDNGVPIEGWAKYNERQRGHVHAIKKCNKGVSNCIIKSNQLRQKQNQRDRR